MHGGGWGIGALYVSKLCQRRGYNTAASFVSWRTSHFIFYPWRSNRCVRRHIPIGNNKRVYSQSFDRFGAIGPRNKSIRHIFVGQKVATNHAEFYWETSP